MKISKENGNYNMHLFDECQNFSPKLSFDEEIFKMISNAQQTVIIFFFQKIIILIGWVSKFL